VSLIEPIDELQQNQVREQVQKYLRKAAEIFGKTFKPIEVRFDLKGRAAGMYCVKGRERWIRINPWLCNKYFEDSMTSTVPHEVAHYVVNMVYGWRHIRPHGNEWQTLMVAFGAEPNRTGDYSLEGIPVRRQKRYVYKCACMQHQLSTVRHRRAQSGEKEYTCRQCRQVLAQQ